MGPTDRKKRAQNKWATKLGLMAMSLSLTFLVLEIIFTFFVIQSDYRGNLTHSSRRWHAKYWNPINSFGFRDREPSAEELKNNKKLFVLGDSFVAGQGIKHMEDRFSNILHMKMQPGWTVMCIAKRGWSTPDQVRVLKEMPIKPDGLVWTYFFNDIETAAAQNGIYYPPYVKRPHGLLRPFVEHSSVFNYFYWRLLKPQYHDMGDREREWDKTYFKHGPTWETHKKEIEEIIQYSKDMKIPMVAVVFPLLGDVEGSRWGTSLVVEVLKINKIPTIDLTDELASRKTSELVVNALDHHPNKTVHKEVAHMIWKMMQGKNFEKN